MRLRFAIRDLLWLTLVVAMAAASIVCPRQVIAADEPTHTTGTLKGRFIYNGSAPEPAVVVHDKYEIIDESLLVPRMLGVQNIFVWVQSKDIPVPAQGKLDPVTVEFKEGRF